MTGVEKPHVTLKLATSLDGRIATSKGESQWVTGKAARQETHVMRSRHDAILVGSGTVLADDPMLTARLEPLPDQQPIRLVADSRLRTPINSKLVQTAREYRTIIACGLEVKEEREREYVGRGVEVWSLPIAPLSGISISALLAECAEQGIQSIFLEGGGALAASFLKARAVDQIEWFRAPLIIGGDGTPCVGALNVEFLGDCLPLERTDVKTIGADIWETYVLRRESA